MIIYEERYKKILFYIYGFYPVRFLYGESHTIKINLSVYQFQSNKYTNAYVGRMSTYEIIDEENYAKIRVIGVGGAGGNAVTNIQWYDRS